VPCWDDMYCMMWDGMWERVGEATLMCVVLR
jgi:hypothetical protein